MNCNLTPRNSIAIEEAFCRLLGDRHTYKDYRKRAGVKQSQLEPLFGLNEFEQLAIWLYSSSLPLHARLNSGLWLRLLAGIKPTTEFRIFALLLNGAIRKLPIFSGTTYRGYRAIKLDHYVGSLSRNNTYMNAAFLSASKLPEGAYFGNILFTINLTMGGLLATSRRSRKKKRFCSLRDRSFGSTESIAKAQRHSLNWKKCQNDPKKESGEQSQSRGTGCRFQRPKCLQIGRLSFW